MNKKKPLFDEREIQIENQAAYYLARVVIVGLVCALIFSWLFSFQFRAMEIVRFDGPALPTYDHGNPVTLPLFPGAELLPDYYQIIYRQNPVDWINYRKEEKLSQGPAVLVWWLFAGYELAVCTFLASTLLYKRVKMVKAIIMTLSGAIGISAVTVLLLALRFPSFRAEDRFLFEPSEIAMFIWILFALTAGMMLGILVNEKLGYESFKLLPRRKRAE